MKFQLRKPCSNCPFRSDAARLPLREARAQDLADGLDRSTFTCHKTAVYDAESDEMVEGPNAQHCAGALIMLEHEGSPSQAMRIAERLRIYDRRVLDMESPVFRSRDEFVEANAGDVTSDT